MRKYLVAGLLSLSVFGLVACGGTSGTEENIEGGDAGDVSSGGTGSGFGDGVQRVGSDIQPGTYRNTDSSLSCYWARLSGFGGDGDDIIANEISRVIQIVTIKSTDVGFEATDCGRWEQVQ